MKVKTKFKISRKFIASMEVLSESDKTWLKSIDFVKSIMFSDYSELTKSQRDWLNDIMFNLKKSGMIK